MDYKTSAGCASDFIREKITNLMDKQSWVEKTHKDEPCYEERCEMCNPRYELGTIQGLQASLDRLKQLMK